MAPKRVRSVLGYTALEALVLLVVLAALAMTSLAVYQKLETGGGAPAQTPNPQEPAAQSSAESTAAPKRIDD